MCRLVSETFTVGPASSKCFTFWYHAYGDGVGTLSIFTANENRTMQTLIWKLNGKQSVNNTDWKYATVPLENLSQTYKIVIEGTVGNDYDGDIA